MGGLRQPYLTGMADSLDTMWDLAMEVAGKGDPVPYARCVEVSTAKPPEPSQPEKKRERAAELLGRAGYAVSNGGLLEAVDAWRKERILPMASVRALGAAVIAHFDNLSAKNLLPYLPRESGPGAAGEHRLLADQGCLVFRLDELPGAGAQRRRHVRNTKPATRSMLRCRCRIRSLSSS